MSDQIYGNNNIKCRFDSEVCDIEYIDNQFILSTDISKFSCKKVLLATGRSGWRWNKTIFDKFGLKYNNDIAKYGIRIETDSNNLKQLNKSSCKLFKDGLRLVHFVGLVL